MYVIGTIKFPRLPEATELYLQCSQQASLVTDTQGQAICFSPDSTVSFNTYFNSIYEAFYSRYTTLRSVYWLLHLAGSFRVDIYREWYGNSQRQCLVSVVLENCQPADSVKVEIPEFAAGDDAGRIYFELTCLSPQGQFLQGVVATDQPPQQAVSLAIVTCTFKKEDYIRDTVNCILQDQSLQDKCFKVFVVDNGRTLQAEDFPDRRVCLIPNRNLGGSGGFAYGLLQAAETDSYSHLVCMDDDVELESESILKLFSLYEYAASDFAISGSMLDLCSRHILYEAGAIHARKWFKDGFDPFELTPLKHKLDLRESASLNALLFEEKVDYGGFWFFAFPKQFLDEIGLPMPFFIKIDDVEFGLRISQRLQKAIVAFPAIAVWHEPFYLKFPVWDTYYYFRNYLIAHSLLDSLSYLGAVADISKRIFYMLLFFDYNSARMLVRAFEDYFHGPELIKNTDTEALHAEILQLSKHHKNFTLKQNYLLPDQEIYSQKAGLLQKAASFLTLNGHFLPHFLLKDQPAYVYLAPDRPGQRSRAFGHKRVALFKEQAGSLYLYDMNQKAAFSLLFDWLKAVIGNGLKWSHVRKQWKASAQELTSRSFWKSYLQLQQSSASHPAIEPPACSTSGSTTPSC